MPATARRRSLALETALEPPLHQHTEIWEEDPEAHRRLLLACRQLASSNPSRMLAMDERGRQQDLRGSDRRSAKYPTSMERVVVLMCVLFSSRVELF
jgi:hypothetical protein